MFVNQDLGQLWLRLVFGGFMAFGHGLPKLLKFSELAQTFPDPIGLGSELSLVMAIGAELGCAILVLVGLLTRLSSLPVMFTMLVAAFVVLADGPFFLPAQGAKEPSLLFFAGFAAIFILGPGRYSVDELLKARKRVGAK